MLSKIQYISQGTTVEEQIQNISTVLEAGCKWIQLRFKNASKDEFKATALKAKQLCKEFEATFIINDHVALAKEIDADGVHLGLTDTSIENARSILGFDKIIGGTANTLEDVLQRIEEKCDYVGLGPYRFTSTKEKLSPILGLQGFKEIVKQLDMTDKNIPIYAIGGIELNDIDAIIDAGIYGIALSGILTNQKDTKEIVTQLNQKTHANA